jgi:hypothetical protein
MHRNASPFELAARAAVNQHNLIAIESKSQDQLVIDPVDVLVNVMFVAS